MKFQKKKMKRKLLLIGSDTIHVFNYYNLIKSYFDEILVITDKLRDSFNYENVVTANFSIKSIQPHLSTSKFIEEKINNFTPSIIHIHQANSYAYYSIKALKNKNIPVVITAWGSDVLYTPHLGKIYRKMTEFCLDPRFKFTSDSLYMAYEMQKLSVKGNLDISIANFGINVLDVNHEKENLIYSNRLHKKFYRIDKIIDAFHKFSKKQQEKWKLVIAATGDETENLKQQVQNYGITDQVDFVGFLDAAKNSEYYAKAKYYVSVPESDGTAISLLEAMYLGCIPIVANLPANYEWIINQVNGIIVDNLNSNFLAKALSIDTKFASDFNRNLIAQKGTKEVNRKIFIDIYDNLLK